MVLSVFFFSFPLPCISLNTKAATLVKLLFHFFEKSIQGILCVCTHKTGTSCVFLMLCVDVFPLVISAFLLTKSLVFFQCQSQNSVGLE